MLWQKVTLRWPSCPQTTCSCQLMPVLRHRLYFMCPSSKNLSTVATAQLAARRPYIPGTEPRTSRTQSVNRTTRPNSEMVLSKIALLICARINFLRTQRSDSNFLPDPFEVCSFGRYQKGLVMEDWAPVAIDIIYFTGLMSSIDAPMV